MEGKKPLKCTTFSLIPKTLQSDRITNKSLCLVTITSAYE